MLIKPIFLNFWGEQAIAILDDALAIWKQKYESIFGILVQDPSEFQNGVIWNTVTGIIRVIEATGVSLLITFFFYGIIKSTIDYRDLIRNPRLVLMQFVRFFFAKFFVMNATDVMLSIISVVRHILAQINPATPTMEYSIPNDLRTALETADWGAGMGAFAASLVGTAMIWLLSIILVVVVYGRFFKIFLLSAIAPIPLAGFASEATSLIGRNFLKSYIAECLRGVLMLTACVIFSAFTTITTEWAATSPGGMTWDYVGNVTLQMLLLVIVVKGSDRIVKEIFSL